VGQLGFWFEFASPYSYLSAARIEDVAARAAGGGVTVSWKPFLLGPIFREHGWNDSPFNVYPIKGRYMWRDVERFCERYGIPFARPSRFPRSGLLAARVACLAKAEARPWLPEFARTVYRANFAEDREISDPLEVRSVLDSLGEPGAEIVGRAQTDENKRSLRDHTSQAASLGIFGAPSFVAGGELFWGNDRLEDAVDWAIRTASPIGDGGRPGGRISAY
jgi:2-hydroxychromene-2-carboxylate isomerase